VWQDWVTTTLLIATIWSVTMLLKEAHKPSLRHCISSIVFSITTMVVQFSLGLWLSCVMQSAYSILWIVVARQRYKLNRSNSKQVDNVTICTMCEMVPATTTWGFPVCESCAESLTLLNRELKLMETEDPELAEKGRRAEESLGRFLNNKAPEL
jgi:hypothetical protein